MPQPAHNPSQYPHPPGQATRGQTNSFSDFFSPSKLPVATTDSDSPPPPSPSWTRPPTFGERLSAALSKPGRGIDAFRSQVADLSLNMSDLETAITLYLKAGRADLVEDLIIMRANSQAHAKVTQPEILPSASVPVVIATLCPRLAEAGWLRTIEAVAKARLPAQLLPAADFLKPACELLARELPACVDAPDRVGSLWRFADVVMGTVSSIQPSVGPEPTGSALWVSSFLAQTIRKGIDDWLQVKDRGADPTQAAARRLDHLFDVLLHNEDRSIRSLPAALDFVRQERDRWRAVQHEAREGRFHTRW